ncbi:hypothetical protein [Lactobacillus sp. PV034]|uniref:hypothetical protein n=1 Tax=Lactobacillus sp. PV034 TaxID=2594495 RepID=UPI00223EAE19|nr:hypothetical protein [Lactobacillus sp. PV034]QNQ80771.1 hypothetical protein FP432_03990 [Lactobacillus sp. PV034]
MKKEIQRVRQRLNANPIHLIIGLLLLLTGFYLLVTDSFFLWPPEWHDIFNDDRIDAIAIILGTCYFAFVLAGGTNQLANTILLGASAFYLTMIIVLEIGHALAFQVPGLVVAAIFQLGALLLIEYCARRSPTIKRRK